MKQNKFDGFYILKEYNLIVDCYKAIGFILLLGMWNGIAEADANKYSAIPQRNAFNLREPEPPKPVEQPPPPINVKLTGITTILDSKRAFLLVQEQGKPQAESKVLKEGEKDGEIEVVKINEVEGEVKIINSGKEVTLNFEKDGVKPSTTPVAATGVPLPPGGGRPVIPLPGAIPVYGGYTNNPNANVSIQGRTIPPNPYGATGYQSPQINPGINPPATPSTPSIPRPVRLPGSKY